MTPLCACGAVKEHTAKQCRSCYNTARHMQAVLRTKKTCSACGGEKLLAEFSLDQRVPDGRQAHCRLCQKLRIKASGHHAQRKYRLRKVYGLTVAEYDLMYERQNRCCSGCHQPIKRHGRQTHVDHDHVTGVVRGILCRGCNTALGYVRDDTHCLRGLIHYLEYKKAA